MSDKARPDDPTKLHVDIPSEVEERVLEILDRTEPGPERDAEIDTLCLAPGLRRAVQAWLEDEDPGTGAFLASPAPRDAATAPDRAPSGSLPRRLGDYELESVLGKGGMGIVYRARDLKLGRIVALKVLPERFADEPKRLQRFEREVRAVAALRHPSIVRVYEADQIDGVPYFTMELCEGRSLDRVIQFLDALAVPVERLKVDDWVQAVGTGDGSGSGDAIDRTYLEAVCHLVINVADALQHAHDNGVTHRDVKPSNIIAEGRGRAKLFDFGLARVEDDLAMTRSSEVIGSPHYMSPEQVEGGAIDHRTDVYSLGVTLYELLTLKVPLEIESPQQVFQMIVHREPRRPGLLNPNLPRDLETICLTAIEKDPARRFPSAAEFAEDLRRFLRFEPIRARPIGSFTRSVRWLRRNRMPASLVFLVIVGLVAVYFTQRSGAQKIEKVTSERDIAEQQLGKLRQQQAEAETRLREITAQAKTARDDLARTNADLEKNQQEQARLESANRKLDERNRELQTDARMQQKQLDELRTSGARLQRQSEELRQQSAALRTQQETLQRDIAGKRQELRTAQDRLERTERDLGSLQESHRLTTINKLLMEARTLRDANAGLGLIVASEAARLADRPPAVDTDLQIRVDDTLLELLRTTQERCTFTLHGHPVTAIDFSPSGANLVSADLDGVVHVWERESGRLVARRQLPSALVHAEFAAEDWLLLALENGDLLSWDGLSRSAPVRLATAWHQPQILRHGAPGGELAVAHTDRRPGLLAVHNRSGGGPARTLGADDEPIIAFEFTPIRDLILATTAGRHVQLWNIRTGTRVSDVRADAPLLAATCDAQGRRIATLDAAGTLQVLDAGDSSLILSRRINDGNPLGTGRIAFCAEDLRLFVSATGLAENLFLDPLDGAVLGRLPASRPVVDFRLDRRRALVCIADRLGGFDIVSTYNGRVVTHLAAGAPPGPRRRPVVAFDPTGDSVATVYGETEARIWHTSPGGALHTVGPGLAGDPVGRDSSAAAELLITGGFEPGNGRVVTASNLGLSSWHLATGTRRFLAHDPRRPLGPHAIARNGDGIAFDRGAFRLLVSGQRPTVRAFRSIENYDVDQVLAWPGGLFGLVISGAGPGRTRVLRIIDGHGREAGRYGLPAGRAGGGTPQPSPDGSRYLIGYDDLSVVSLADPDRAIPLPFTRRPAEFSRDGSRIAASTGFSVKLFDATTGAELCELRDLPSDYSEVTCIRFFPDGQRLATAWSDGVVRIHDGSGRTPDKLVEIVAHRDRIHSLAIDTDASRLLTTSADGTARLWRLSDPRLPPLTFAPGSPCLYGEFRDDDAAVLVVCPRAVHTFPVDLRRLARAACPRRLSAAERALFGLTDQRR